MKTNAGEQTHQWWDTKTAEIHIPRSPRSSARTIPTRYHREGLYHTNDSATPLWKEVIRKIKSPCPPSLDYQGSQQWTVDYCVITCPALAKRVLELFLKYSNEPALSHYLKRTSRIQL